LIYHVFVGTYASSGDEALHWMTFDAEGGTLKKAGGIKGIDRPSYLALHPRLDIVYAVSETEQGNVAAFRFDVSSGEMEEINRRPTDGVWPCHLALSPDGRELYVVNYGTGTFAVYPVGEDGSIGEKQWQWAHEGRSVRDDRQERSHPHSIWNIPGTGEWLVPDLGTDNLYLYRRSRASAPLALHSVTPSKPGAGPRHAAFHPRLPIVYVIEELTSTITAYALERANGRLNALQTVATLPDDYSGENTCAHIQMTRDGNYLFGSNRGHDSIAVFRVEENGLLAPSGTFHTGGRTPRNFTVVDGSPYLLAANQDSDNLVVFRLSDDGSLEMTGTKAVVAKPSCIVVKPV